LHDINNKSNTKGRGEPKRKNHKNKSTNGFMATFPGASTTMVRTHCLGAPKRMNSTFRMAVQGYLPAASGASGQALINASAWFEPFASPNPLTTGWASLSLTNGSSTTAPFPLSAFYGAGFKQCRVRASSLKVTAITGANGDCVNVWILPVVTNATVATNFQQATGSPGFVGALVPAGCRPIVLRSAPPIWQVLGYENERVYLDSSATISGTTTSGVNPAFSTVWQVSYATMDSTATVGQVYFDFEVEMNVDFFDPIQQNI